jgi:serine phosphatase RsbU (regulator of sigma subunit)/DNA-binding transcriptional regulator YhcF (GntR family)
MLLSNDETRKASAIEGNKAIKAGRARLARDLFDGHFRSGQLLSLREIAQQYGLNEDSVLNAFAEFQVLGLVALSGNFSAVVQSPNPKEMQEAYEIRAALEEIAGRAAASFLKGNTSTLLKELNSMRAAMHEGNFDDLVEHDLNFHRIILKASHNELLSRVWDTLAIDMRIRSVLVKLLKDLPEVIESHQPIIDALERGRGREAGVLLRNHVETMAEYLKKSQSDSGFHRAFRRDLEGAKDVQQAFFPPQSFSIPCLSCETFYQPAHEIGGDYYDFLSLPGGRWGIAIGDVSGKGIGAALIMASLQASLRAQALHPHTDLSTLIADVNRLVFGSSPTNFFASLFYAEYEPATRVLNYVNAGHNPPVVVRFRNGSCEVFQLMSEAMPVGVAAEARFDSTSFQLEIGDLLVACTDGVTEAENPKGELWGQNALETVLRSCSGTAPELVIERILQEISTFSGNKQRDDVTLVVMSVQEGCDVDQIDSAE